MLNEVKKCRRCGVPKSKDSFVDISGAPNPRGGYCTDCHLIRVTEWEQKAKEEKESKIRKLKIIYGEWWRNYSLPRDFDRDIYFERDYCPYCGHKLPPYDIKDQRITGDSHIHTHLDHMDPLQLGGEDSIRNVVYVCEDCNHKKGKRSFIEWIKKLSPNQREISREIYEAKHGHPPESFVPGLPNERCDGVAAELFCDEEELKKMYPKPIVDGPPKSGPASITLAIDIDNEGNFVITTEA
jgi:5-methylcytosine-specific restriction endonuclease McrA